MKHPKLPLAVLLLALMPGLRSTAQIIVGDTLTTTIAAADTLPSGVIEWSKARAHATNYGENRDLLTGATHDLSLLDIHGLTLFEGKSFEPPAGESADRLLIVREGSITVTVGAVHKVLGPGGIGLFTAGDHPVFLNSGTVNTVCFLLSFRGKGRADYDRAKQAGPPLLLDWPELTVKKTAIGESRPIFSRPVAWLRKIDMHATTLDPGRSSHPQHIHRDEEIILMRSGQVREGIGEIREKGVGGDLFFLASGVPHNLENGDSGRAEYYALQWEP